MTLAPRLALLAIVTTACGGSVDEDEPQPLWPDSGCPPAFDLVDGKCTVREIFVPGGTFQMGRGYCPDAGVLESPPDLTCPLADAPHSVTVAPFWVDATVRSFGPLLSETECPSGRIECADPGWYSSVPGGGKSVLPHQLGPDIGPTPLETECLLLGKHHLTEAQWEFIATWGGTRTYPWGEDEPACDHGNISSDCEPRNLEPLPDSRFSKVASYPPSPEGIYDLIGNRGEIPAPSPEAYGPGYTAVLVHDPPCIAAGQCSWSFDVVYPVRGGRLDGPPERFRAPFRGVRPAKGEQPDGGQSFRCARPAE